MSTYQPQWQDWWPKTPRGGTDKTDRSTFVSSVSSPPGHFLDGLAAGDSDATQRPATIAVLKTRQRRTDKTDKSLSQASKLTTDTTDKSQIPARIVLLAVPEGVPEAWGQGVADMLTRSTPGRISPERWNRLREDAYKLLRDWAAKARACGWNELDLFGCHPTRPLARPDCAGLVMLMDTWEVVSLNDDGADLRASGPLRFQPGMIGDEAVPLWEL